MKDANKVQGADLGAIFDAHVRHEFVDHDVTATIPTLTGGDGNASVRDFYKQHFVGKMPADTRIEQISRTVSKDQVVDELIVQSTSCFPVSRRPGERLLCRTSW
ncbi:MAG: hypothetical protein USCAAHI_00439 [Beijerinckiaceae bacterium]|jgi:carboxymethylenebutenolidase|nr:MAG: hypothetical protein USCAAHI_00439 [Beijerinckiaceae bacterium]